MESFQRYIITWKIIIFSLHLITTLTGVTREGIYSAKTEKILLAGGARVDRILSCFVYSRYQ